MDKNAPLDIVYYTDPLCCWSWTFEPAIQQLKGRYAGALTWRNCMGGMLSDWKSYHDTLQAITRPVQMGPVWMQARQLSGIYLNDSIWFVDPPASSYPACVAVKCAGLQSPAAEELYLHKLREAVMQQCKNIARKEVLVALAEEIEKEMPLTFNAERFVTEIGGTEAIEAFRKDLQELRYRGISRLPSLLITEKIKGRSLLLTGSHSYESITAKIEQLTRAGDPVGS